MKMFKMLTVLVVFGLSALAFVSCSNEDTNNFEAERTEFQQQVQNEIDRLDNRINELQKDAKEVKEDAREKLDEQIDGLEDVRNDLKNDLKKLGSATKQSWNEVKSDISKTMNRVKEALTIDEPASK